MGYIGQAPTKIPLTSADITDGTIALADMAANSVDSDSYVDGSVDLIHMSSQSVDEDNLYISNSGSNGEFLSKQSGDAGGLTWAAGGGTTGKHSMWIPASAMLSSRSNGCSSLQRFETTANNPDFQTLNFSGSLDQHALFGIAFPKSWNEGTITYRVFWGVTDTAATDGTDTVSWKLAGRGVADDASVNQTYGTQVAITEATSGTVEDIAISAESSAVTITTAAVDTMTFFRVTRDVSADDLAEEAALIGIQIFLTTDAETDA